MDTQQAGELEARSVTFWRSWPVACYLVCLPSRGRPSPSASHSNPSLPRMLSTNKWECAFSMVQGCLPFPKDGGQPLECQWLRGDGRGNLVLPDSIGSLISHSPALAGLPSSLQPACSNYIPIIMPLSISLPPGLWASPVTWAQGTDLGCL